MSSSDAVADPWRTTEPDRPPAPRPDLGRWATLVIAWAAANTGVVGALWRNGAFAEHALRVMAVGTAIVVAGLALPADRQGRRALLVVAGAAVTTFGSIPYAGRAPSSVALASALVATATFHRWEPWTGWPSRDRRVVAAAVPLFAGAQVVWARSTDLVVTAVLLVASLGVVEATHRAPHLVRPVDAALRRATRALATAAGTGVTLLVATPLLYLPGLVARALDALRRTRRGEPRWQEWDADPNEVRRDARHLFATPGRRERRRRRRMLVGGTAVVALVGWGAAGWYQQRLDDRRRAASPAERLPASSLPAFRGFEDADQLQRDQLQLAATMLRPGVVGDYLPADFTSPTTNTRAGARRTTPAPRCDCRRAVVWIVGGSAAFGMGQRDEGTIASQLVGVARSSDWSLTVRNIAVPGWTLWQEQQGVLARLALGSERPDLVVFYDGFNDVAGALFRSIRAPLDPTAPIILEPTDVQAAIASGARSFGDAERTAELGRFAAGHYLALRDLVAGQLAAQGIDSLFVFQPDAFTTATQRQGIAAIYRDTPDQRALFLSSAPALEAASRAMEPEVHNLRHLFDDEPTPVFADTVHTNERGARVAAEAVFELARPLLDDLDRP